MILAKVMRSGKREFDCKILETQERIEAPALGNLLKSTENIVVGDIVRLEKIPRAPHYQIVSVGERQSEIYRILVREGKRKVVAANVDCLVVITSASLPQYKRGLLDRYLVRGAQWDIPGMVVFNKMDQYDPTEFDIAFEAERLKPLGVKCFEMAAKFEDYQKRHLELGREELFNELKGKTSLFLGHSGVGKSKTISLLTGGQVNLRNREIGKSGKGTHTTSWSEIIDCGNFELIDSPGIRSFSLDDLDPDDLPSYFPDLVGHFSKCQFSDCFHAPDSKGCSFLKMRENESEGDARVVLSRLESFRRILDEISLTPTWKKKSY